jgi:heme-degrading monooxygenase HmoA
MYAIAVVSQIQMDKMEEAASIFRDSVVPAYKEMKGFKSALLLVDPASGKGLGISLWESEADVKAVQGSGALQQQIGKFAAVMAAPPSPGTYEVKVQA